MIFWNLPDANSCNCEKLENFSVVIWSISCPIIALYVLLIIVGAGNIYRFIKVNSMSKNLALVYIFSMVSSVCWILCFALVTEPNEF